MTSLGPSTGSAKLLVEEGEVYFWDKRTGRMKKMNEYIIEKSCDQQNPVTIGREARPSLLIWMGIKKGKDIVLPTEKYDCASREHCEIFYDKDKKAYFLVDYSLNGTIVNRITVGRNRQRAVQKLEHENLIEIPAVGEKVKMKFLIQ